MNNIIITPWIKKRWYSAPTTSFFIKYEFGTYNEFARATTSRNSISMIIAQDIDHFRRPFLLLDVSKKHIENLEDAQIFLDNMIAWKYPNVVILPDERFETLKLLI